MRCDETVQHRRASSLQARDDHHLAKINTVDLRVLAQQCLGAKPIGQRIHDALPLNPSSQRRKFGFGVGGCDEHFERVEEPFVAEITQTRFPPGTVDHLADIQRAKHLQPVQLTTDALSAATGSGR